MRPGSPVRGPGGEWIGLAGGPAAGRSEPGLLVILTIRERHTPVEVAIPLSRVRRIDETGVTLGITRDAVLALQAAEAPAANPRRDP
ncbi:MAG: hypothetical protein ACKOWF_16305 [Chloroflexota bacterium]